MKRTRLKVTKPLRRFWRPEGAEIGGWGFAFGPGFKAHVGDFPEGGRLVVTAHVELPEEPA